jgi:GMP synthase (glutamine-hydrolysing)
MKIKSSPPSRILVLRHVPHEGLGSLETAFRRAGLGFSLLDVSRPAVAYPRAAEARALVVLGGPMGVYETHRYPFLRKELDFIKSFLSTGRPLLGICLGAQLAAHALGARVVRHRHREIGWGPIHLTADGQKDPLLGVFPTRSVVFQWHGDTFDLPKGSRHLASSPLCRNQAFRHGRVYGLQFHTEMTADMIRQWSRGPASIREIRSSGPGAYATYHNGVARHLPALQRSAAKFFASFAGLCG